MLSVYLKFDTERDMLEVQSAVSDLIKNCYYVTKADLMELIGERSRYGDTKIGWDRNGIIIPPDDDTTHWILEFPNPSRIIPITIFERNIMTDTSSAKGQPRDEALQVLSDGAHGRHHPSWAGVQAAPLQASSELEEDQQPDQMKDISSVTR